MAVVLDYRGDAGPADMNAFNARLQSAWSGDTLFRVLPDGGKFYFIRVGGSLNTEAAIGMQFGLLGALWVYFAQKRAKQKTRVTLNDIAGVHPSELLSSHKKNFVLHFDHVQSASISPGGVLGGTNVGKCILVERTGKKRKFTFDDVDNMRLAVHFLPSALRDRVAVKVEWDDTKQKYRKPKVK
jgi:hypothetical protein